MQERGVIEIPKDRRPDRKDERQELALADGECARCRADVDDDGFCSTCGAVTLAGVLRSD